MLEKRKREHDPQHRKKGKLEPHVSCEKQRIKKEHESCGKYEGSEGSLHSPHILAYKQQPSHNSCSYCRSFKPCEKNEQNHQEKRKEERLALPKAEAKEKCHEHVGKNHDVLA